MSKFYDQKILIIFGPTASGKTSLSVNISKYLWGKFDINSEIINVDSRQFYREMNIGTNKIDVKQYPKIKHHFIDIADPDENISSESFEIMLVSKINEVLQRGNVPIIVGGSGTYIMSVFGDKYIGKLKINNGKYRNFEEISELLIPKFDRSVLYKKIERNVELMFKKGLYEEIKFLINKFGEDAIQLNSTLGYKEFLDYIKVGNKNIENLSRIDLEKIKWKIKSETKRYAMHQIGWTKKLRWYKMISIQEIASVIDRMIGGMKK